MSTDKGHIKALDVGNVFSWLGYVRVLTYICVYSRYVGSQLQPIILRIPRPRETHEHKQRLGDETCDEDGLVWLERQHDLGGWVVNCKT